MNRSPVTGWLRAVPVTGTLLALNLLAYVATAVQARSIFDNVHSALFFDGVLYGPLVENGEYRRLLTSAFLHFGPAHLGMNMFFLVLVGTQCERLLGPVRYATTYLAAVLGGGGAALLLTPYSWVAGASGGLFGLMGALAVLTLRARGDMRPILTFIAVNVGFSLLVPGISLAGHLGGLVGGLLAAIALTPLSRGGRRPYTTTPRLPRR